MTVCDSGIRALEVLALPDHGIDLILADVMMPVRTLNSLYLHGSLHVSHLLIAIFRFSLTFSIS